MALAISNVFTEKLPADAGTGGVVKNALSAFKNNSLRDSAAWQDPAGAQARLIREQWDFAKEVYHPLENNVIEKLREGTEPAANRAGAITQSAFSRAREQRRRDQSRYGVQETAAQKKANARRDAIAESTGVADAENSMRRSVEDNNMNTQAKLVGHGAGVASSANENLGTAANLQNAREQTGEAMRSQQKQRQIGGAMSGAAAGFMVGGLPGAAIGGVAGFFLG